MGYNRALLVQIQQDVLALRHDLALLRGDLERAGIIARDRATDDGGAVEDQPGPRGWAKWTPPVLNRLGDMLEIIAQANPSTAQALKQVAGNPKRDPEWDKTKDIKDTDPDTDSQKANTDPNKKDLRNYFWGTADYNPTDWKGNKGVADIKPKGPKPGVNTDDSDDVNYLPDIEGPVDNPA